MLSQGWWHTPVISAFKAQAGGSKVQGQPGLQRKTLSQKKKKKLLKNKQESLNPLILNT
jgi:hypothetical protein